MENEVHDNNNFNGINHSVDLSEGIVFMENENYDSNNKAPELTLENIYRYVAEDSYKEYIEKRENAHKAANQISFILKIVEAVGNSMGGTPSSNSKNDPSSFVGETRVFSFEEWVDFSPEVRDEIIHLYEAKVESLKKWKIAAIVIPVVVILGLFIFIFSL